jgi:hypothetical protein
MGVPGRPYSSRCVKTRNLAVWPSRAPPEQVSERPPCLLVCVQGMRLFRPFCIRGGSEWQTYTSSQSG